MMLTQMKLQMEKKTNQATEMLLKPTKAGTS